jgi:hypothetical protein
MRKSLAVLFAAVLLTLAGGTVAVALTPGPNGNNDGGLCTAYFNGQKKGHDKHGNPRPFAALEEAGREYTDNDGRDNDRDGQIDEEGENQSLSAEENIYNFCYNTAWIGGNPEHGRFTCSDPGASSDPECTRNDPPGNSGGNGRP